LPEIIEAYSAAGAAVLPLYKKIELFAPRLPLNIAVDPVSLFLGRSWRGRQMSIVKRVGP